MKEQSIPVTPDQLQWVLDHNMQIRAGHRVQISNAVEAWRAVIQERDDLLAALKWIAAHENLTFAECSLAEEIVGRARAAIAKAEGR